nr:MAG TPA: hypothetical protein [Caudoviricetes sp.]
MLSPPLPKQSSNLPYLLTFSFNDFQDESLQFLVLFPQFIINQWISGYSFTHIQQDANPFSGAFGCQPLLCFHFVHHVHLSRQGNKKDALTDVFNKHMKKGPMPGPFPPRLWISGGIE